MLDSPGCSLGLVRWSWSRTRSSCSRLPKVLRRPGVPCNVTLVCPVNSGAHCARRPSPRGRRVDGVHVSRGILRGPRPDAPSGAPLSRVFGGRSRPLGGVALFSPDRQRSSHLRTGTAAASARAGGGRSVPSVPPGGVEGRVAVTLVGRCKPASVGSSGSARAEHPTERLQTAGKPMRATGARHRQRFRGATDSRMDQRLEVELGKPGNGKGAPSGGDVVRAVREGKALEGMHQRESRGLRVGRETWWTP